jgi:outer membrane protein TolC
VGENVVGGVAATAKDFGKGLQKGAKDVGRGFQYVFGGLHDWFSPGLVREFGPASVYVPRSGRKGWIYRVGEPPPEPIRLLPVSPEVTAPGYVWSLETAVSRALVANPAVVEAKLMLQRQQGAEAETKARRLPQLALVGSADRRDSDSIDRSPGEFNLPPNSRTAIADRSFDARVELRQLLFDSGGVSNTLQRERLQTLQARLGLQVAAYRSVALVKQHYDAVLFREAVKRNTLRREESLGQLAESAKRRWELGEQPELEYLRAATELKLAEAEVVRAERDLRQARIGFARHLYLPLSDDNDAAVVLAGELQPRSLALAKIDAVPLAVANRLDLQVGRLQVKAAEATVRAVRSDALPKIEAVAGYGMRSSYYDYNRELEGWTVAVTGRWSLFDGHAVRGRTQVYRAEQRVAQVRLEDLDLRVRTEVVELFASLELARSALAAQEEAVALAEKSLAHARRAYQLGQANLEQVLETENVLLRSRNARAEAIYTLNATIAQIEFGVGGVLPGARDVGIEVMP